jgi:hypothetical protein
MYDNAKTGYDISAIAIGMDSLERKLQSGQGGLDTEGLVPIYLGQDLIKAREYTNWGQVKEELDQISQDVSVCPEGPRRQFLDALLSSLYTAMDIFQGTQTDFSYRLTHLVGVPAKEADLEVIYGLHDEIDSALTREKIVNGTLAERIHQWQNSEFIPVDKLNEVYEELQTEAIRRTSATIFDLGDYRMDLVLKPGTYSAGRCNFQESTMEINTDLGCTRAAMKHLVTHENFPGHATQLLYTLDSYKKGTSTADVLLCTLNGIPGVIQEGIGDQATDLIDWVEDDNDVIQIALRRLRIAVATTASWRLMELEEEEESVVKYIQDTGFALDPYVDGRILQARHIYRGPFNASYFFGNQAVREVRLRTPKDQYGSFIKYLYENMHSLEGFLSYGV